MCLGQAATLLRLPGTERGCTMVRCPPTSQGLLGAAHPVESSRAHVLQNHSLQLSAGMAACRRGSPLLAGSLARRAGAADKSPCKVLCHCHRRDLDLVLVI